MNRYIKKYIIIYIAYFILLRLVSLITSAFLPRILLNIFRDSDKTNYILYNIDTYSDYILNIIVAFILFYDLKKNNVILIPLLLLTLFSVETGIIFFLLFINNKISSNEK
jgi:hypothetical protein